MTLNDSDRQQLIKYRLEQADDTILDVELLINDNRLLADVNRIYYGMFYSLLALSFKHNFESSKNAQIIG